MEEKKPIKAVDLKSALAHIKALVFGDQETYDDEGHLKSVFHEEAIVFGGDEEDAVMIEELHKQIEHLKRMVHKDELTGVLNRRGIREEFGRFFEEAGYTKDHPEHRKNVIIKDFSLIFFDIDNFKKVNDVYGHD